MNHPHENMLVKHENVLVKQCKHARTQEPCVLGVPPKILECAREITDYFKQMNIKEFKVLGIQNREN